MNMIPQGPGTVSPTTPPIHGGLLPPPRSSWPTVIGVIAIIVGCWGIFANACATPAGLFFQSQMGKFAPPGASSMFDAQSQVTHKYLPATLAGMIALLTLGIFLLVTGIGVLRRRPWGPRCAM